MLFVLFISADLFAGKKSISKPKKVKSLTRQAVSAPASLGKQGTLHVQGLTVEDFETATFPPTGWRVGNPNSGTVTWARMSGASGYGVGSGSAYMDCYNYSNTGQRDSLKTPVLTGLVSGDLLKFDIAYAENTYGDDSLKVLLSTNGGVSFIASAIYAKGGASLGTEVTDDEYIPPSYPTAWRTEQISLPSSVVGVNVVIAFISRNYYGNNIYIDNIKIGSVAVDLSVTSVSFNQAVIMGVANNVVASVKWLGSAAAPSTISLTYKEGSAPTSSVDGINETLTPSWSGTPPVANVMFTTSYVPLSGGFQMYVRCFETGDGDNSNDIASGNFTGSLIFNAFPYVENFESVSDSGWTTGAISGPVEWMRGAPAKTQMASAHSGVNAWVTKTTGSYSNDLNNYVMSPYFDFSLFTNDPVLSFYNNYKSESGYDGGVIEVSVNGGAFTILGSFEDINGYNWYDYQGPIPDGAPIKINGPSWSGTSALLDNPVNGWVNSFLVLTGLAGESNVQFRFRFISDESSFDEGWAFDDITIFEPSSISGTVFEDLNGDGIKDAGDPGMLDEEVNLTGPQTRTLYTDSDGLYSFVGLPSGTYTVSLTTWGGLVQTLPPSPHTYTAIVNGNNLVDKDFGAYFPGSISGMMFHDINSNGVKDVGETPLENWKIKLSGSIADSVMTSANGLFAFLDLPAGNYTLSEEMQEGWLQTMPANGEPYSITITSNANIANQNFGNFQYGRISGMKFNDANNNGTKDVGELGLTNWKIKLSDAATDSIFTDNDGNYLFTHLLAGNYTVSEENKAGWMQTFPANPGTYSLSVQNASNFTEKDFGNYEVIGIYGKKFDDLDGDGEKGVNEPGISNWKIYLSGATSESTLTDANGDYSFPNLISGNYTVSEENVDGWLQTKPATGTYSINLTGGTVTNIDFGNFKLGKISGMKFEDENGDGFKNVGEVGLENWKIKLSGAADDSVFTDANGFYMFENLTFGDYSVEEENQNGWMQTLPGSGSYNYQISSGVEFSDVDFGNFKLGKISGMKFDDANGDGIKDIGELGVENWKIYSSGNELDSVFTDADGNYLFENLSVGQYSISEEQQNGWVQTYPLSSTYTIDISSGSDVQSNDFGNFQLGSISGIAFDDLDGNGAKDVDEPGIEDWKIYLSGDVSDSVLTDVDGNYSFTNLHAGTYTVRAEVQAGWIQTLPTSPDNYTLEITSGENATEQDFGNFKLGSITGLKFNDVNGNGTKDNGETVLSGWMIYLYSPDINTLVDSMATDDEGGFSFTDLFAGTYLVREKTQSGWMQTTENPDDAIITSGLFVKNLKFGNFQLGTISGKKFNDVNGDGILDANDVGVQNWKIKISGAATDSALTDANGNYTFANLAAGNYSISEEMQTGWMQTLPQSGAYDVTMTSGLISANNNFGNFQYGTVSGKVYVDANSDSVYSVGETGVANWSLVISKNGNAVDTVLTDISGNYSFAQLTFGTYSVSQIVVSGYLTLENGSGFGVDIVSASSFTKNFGVMLDTLKLRTFMQSPATLTAKVVKLKYLVKTNTVVGTPNEPTVLYNEFLKIGKLGSTFLGVAQTSKDSAKKYGWLYFKTASALAKFYTFAHTVKTQYYPIDSLRITGKKAKKLAKAIVPVRKTYDNNAWAEGVLLRLNILASKDSMTPYGFGSLVLDTNVSLAGKNLQGKTLKQVADELDTVMTYWQLRGVTDSSDFLEIGTLINNVIKPINDGFYASMTTDNSYIDFTGLKNKNYYAARLKGIKTATEFGRLVKFVPGKLNEPYGSFANSYTEIPSQFILEQNYPNPFNPSTAICFQLSAFSNVMLKIYNVLGQEVATLLNNEAMEEGEHVVTFDANGLSSGVYFYRVTGTTVNEEMRFESVKKMLLLK
jgi:hypothetical protein